MCATYVSTCVYLWFVLAYGSFCECIHVFWSFMYVSFVGTQCGFIPLCVAHFLFVTDLLLMHYSALCVLCYSYILNVTLCILINLVAISFWWFINILGLVLLQGSTRGVAISVKVLLCKFRASHSLVLSVHIPISFFKFSQCGFGWYFLVRWVGYFGGVFIIITFVLVATICLPGIGICISLIVM